MLLPHTSEWVSHPHGDRVSQELSPFPSVPLSLVGKFRMNESHVFAQALGRLVLRILTRALAIDLIGFACRRGRLHFPRLGAQLEHLPILDQRHCTREPLMQHRGEGLSGQQFALLKGLIEGEWRATVMQVKILGFLARRAGEPGFYGL